MRKVLNSGTFANLEEFEISEHWPGALTTEAVYLPIQFCSHLKRIRGLVGCPRLNEILIQELKHKLLVGNFDINIQ
jgi:hypothetical protein